MNSLLLFLSQGIFKEDLEVVALLLVLLAAL
jgi:hypothetical protein